MNAYLKHKTLIGKLAFCLTFMACTLMLNAQDLTEYIPDDVNGVVTLNIGNYQKKTPFTS